MINIKGDAITFNMFYEGKNVIEFYIIDNLTKMKTDETTPAFRNINIENVICNGVGLAMEFNGLPEIPIDGIYLKNVNIIASSRAEFNNAKNIVKDNLNIIIN